MFPIWLVDISNWQGDLDIAGVAASGYDAIVCKATEGTDYSDPWFATYIPEILAAGKIPGAYHFLRRGDGAAQARFFHSRIAAFGGPDGWLIQLDCESDGRGEEIAEFTAEWNRLTGSHPFLIYSGAWWWPSDLDGAQHTPYLWHSHYVSGRDYGSVLYEQVPDAWWTPGYGGWGRATILQFSSTGNVAGSSLDVNAFLGTLDELRALTRGTATPTPTPTPTPGPSDWTQELIMSLPEIAQGASGDAVRVIQGLAVARGQNISIDGSFGPNTAQAVRNVQSNYGIGVDGVVGPHTYSVLIAGHDL